MSRIVFSDQWPSVRADSLGDGPYVTPGIKIPTARGIVIMFYSGDDCFSDVSLLADLGHGEANPAARLL